MAHRERLRKMSLFEPVKRRVREKLIVVSGCLKKPWRSSSVKLILASDGIRRANSHGSWLETFCMDIRKRFFVLQQCALAQAAQRVFQTSILGGFQDSSHESHIAII